MQRSFRRRAFLKMAAGAMFAATPGAEAAVRRRRKSSRVITTGTIFVVSSATNSVATVDLVRSARAHTVGVGAAPTNVVFDQKRRRLYVSNFGANSISVIDRDSGSVVAAFDSTSGPAAMSLDETSDRLYVCNVLSGTVRAIDLSSGTTVGIVTVGTHPNSIVGDPRNKRLYVVNSGSGTVSYVDIAGQHSVATSVPVDAAADSIVLSHDGASAFVANTAAGSVSVLNLDERRITATIVGLRQPHAIAVISDERMYVAEAGSPTIAVVDIKGAAVLSRITLGGIAIALRTNGATDRVFAVGYQAGSVSIIETSSGIVTRILTGFSKPRDMAIDG